MTLTIGIPRALMYYRFAPIWRQIFEENGYHVVESVSPRGGYIKKGEFPGISDFCLPVKLYLAHAIDVSALCDYLFVPRLISFSQDTYNCPHFLGIPDVLRSQMIKNVPLIEPILDVKNRKNAILTFFKEINSSVPLTQKGPQELAATYHSNLEALLAHFPFSMKPQPFVPISKDKAKFTIGFVGRPYIQYEPEIGGKIFSLLKKEKITLITPEMVSLEDKIEGVKNLARPIFWHNGRENAGAAYHLLEKGTIDGLIQIVTFGCGPDSLVKELIDRKADAYPDIPYLSLVLDQHSTVEGLQTRLEAFLDMLKRKHYLSDNRHLERKKGR